MSKLEKLSKREGIIAAACRYADSAELEFYGEELWRETIAATFRLLQVTPEAAIRVSIGTYTVFAEGRDVFLFAVVIPTGHPVAKSLRRTLRRYATPKPRKTNVEGQVERAPAA